MGRPKRHDEPGCWYHVMNRGLARRTMFERKADIRYFLSLLAREVRAGRIEVHAFSILGTHFHLLMRSLVAEMSLSLQRMENLYVRRFNRCRRRDGPLVRGRFVSRPVDTMAYRHLLVPYIDQNPVSAGLASAPEAYLYGSARSYGRSGGPPWLERTWIEETVRQATGTRIYNPADYRRVFGGKPVEGRMRLVERRISAGAGDDDLDDLISAEPAAVQDWMCRKAWLADGTRPGLPIVDAPTILEVVRASRLRNGSWLISPTRKSREAWPVIHCGLLRDLASAPWKEIAVILAVDERTARKYHAVHGRLLREDVEYREFSAVIAREAIDSCHGLLAARSGSESAGICYGTVPGGFAPASEATGASWPRP